MDRVNLASPFTIRLMGCVVILGLAGCGPTPASTGTVHGRVTFANKPVGEGTVSFFNVKTGFPTEFPLDADGVYAGKADAALPVGEYVVMITPTTQIIDNEPGKTPPALVEKAAPNIPMKYRRQSTTPLRAAIAVGVNEHNFALIP